MSIGKNSQAQSAAKHLRMRMRQAIRTVSCQGARRCFASLCMTSCQGVIPSSSEESPCRRAQTARPAPSHSRAEMLREYALHDSLAPDASRWHPTTTVGVHDMIGGTLSNGFGGARMPLTQPFDDRQECLSHRIGVVVPPQVSCTPGRAYRAIAGGRNRGRQPVRSSRFSVPCGRLRQKTR